MFETSKRVVDLIQFISDEFQRHPDGHKEIYMILKQAVDIVLAVKTPVHDQLNLRITKNIQIFE